MLSFLYSPTLTSIMTPGKIIALTRWTFVGKVLSLLFNMLSRLVIAFLSFFSFFSFYYTHTHTHKYVCVCILLVLFLWEPWLINCANSLSRGEEWSLPLFGRSTKEFAAIFDPPHTIGISLSGNQKNESTILYAKRHLAWKYLSPLNQHCGYPDGMKH